MFSLLDDIFAFIYIYTHVIIKCIYKKKYTYVNAYIYTSRGYTRLTLENTYAILHLRWFSPAKYSSTNLPLTILTYDSKYKPYHLHSPFYHADKVSQKLIRPSTLQLAPGFRPRLSFLENELILLWQILQSYNLPMGSQKAGDPSKPLL